MSDYYEKILEYIFGPHTDENRLQSLKSCILGFSLLITIGLLLCYSLTICFTLLTILVILLIFIDSIDEITIVKFIDFLAFCIANLVVYLIFENFFSIEQKWFYVVLFFLSIIIVKLEWVLGLIGKILKINTSINVRLPKFNVSIRIFLTVIPITIKRLCRNPTLSEVKRDQKI